MIFKQLTAGYKIEWDWLVLGSFVHRLIYDVQRFWRWPWPRTLLGILNWGIFNLLWRLSLRIESEHFWLHWLWWTPISGTFASFVEYQLVGRMPPSWLTVTIRIHSQFLYWGWYLFCSPTWQPITHRTSGKPFTQALCASEAQFSSHPNKAEFTKNEESKNNRPQWSPLITDFSDNVPNNYLFLNKFVP